MDHYAQVRNTSVPPLGTYPTLPTYMANFTPEVGGFSSLSPLAPLTPPATAAGATTEGLGGLLNNLGSLRQMVDRMGGIDGILSNMGKIQKMIGTMQQMGPMFKLLLGGLGGARATATARPNSELNEYPRRRRRRRRRQRVASGRRQKGPRIAALPPRWIDHRINSTAQSTPRPHGKHTTPAQASE
jgi:hypothetical protein